jgi:membrane carboxypeptidase/penicillin-binding protein
MGISSPLERSLALALGASIVSPLELTAAYAPFANGGYRVTPSFVTSVIDAGDNVLEMSTPTREPVLDPALSYLMTSLLESTVTSGTAQSLKGIGWTHPSAGKTGTTNEGRDAWFIGYTQDLLTGVWVGDDEGSSANVSGSRNALPIWARFMIATQGARPKVEFETPVGITTVKIDPTTGLLARSGCPSRSEEMFVPGTEPTIICPVHAGGIKGIFQRIFRKKPPEPEKKKEQR